MRSNPFGPNCEDLFLYFMMRFVKASIKAGGVGVDSREVWQKGAFVVGIYWPFLRTKTAKQDPMQT